MIKRYFSGDLRKINLIAALLLAAQAVAIAMLSRARYYDITAPFALFNSVTGELDQGARRLFDINLVWPVAALLLLGALAHLALANRFRRQYEAGLKRGVNRVRWLEGAVTWPLMLVIIGLISGISDIVTLVLIAKLGAIQNLVQLTAEVQRANVKRVGRVSFAISLAAGLLPWLVFAVYAVGTRLFGNSDLPNYVYAVYGVIFALSIALAVVTYRQLAKRGRLADYFVAERLYVLLGFLAKSALAWLIFAGTLHK